MRRFGHFIYLKAEHIEEYKKIHAQVWPEVLKQIKDCNIFDYSIYLTTAPRPMLFATFKYKGDDFGQDMEKMRQNLKVQEWWSITDSFQESPVDGAKGSSSGDWWGNMEEVFHFSGS